jgi:hypothetical protein
VIKLYNRADWLSWKELSSMQRLVTVLFIIFFTVLLVLFFWGAEIKTDIETVVCWVMRIVLVAWICWWAKIFKKDCKK